jgi:hypothetical protein
MCFHIKFFVLDLLGNRLALQKLMGSTAERTALGQMLEKSQRVYFGLELIRS